MDIVTELTVLYVSTDIDSIDIIYKRILKLNLWLTAHKGATSDKQNSATDWQMTVRLDNVISIKLRQCQLMLTFLIISASSQFNIYQIVLPKLDGTVTDLIQI